MANVGTPKTPRLAASSVLAPECLLDLGAGDGLLGVRDGEPLGELLPLVVAGDVAPFGPYGVEDRAYERRLGALGDGEPERAQRVERMRRRHAKGDAVPCRVPVAPAISMHALGRNLRRPLVLPMAEEPGEENRAIGDRPGPAAAGRIGRVADRRRERENRSTSRRPASARPPRSNIRVAGRLCPVSLIRARRGESRA